MIPLLTYPLALIGAVAIPALVAVYFFRIRSHRRQVSSLMLWSRVPRPREGGAHLQRLAMPLSFLLELLILALLCAAASDPRLPSDISRKPIIFILDDSASMLAGTASSCPRAVAAAELETLCARPDTGPVSFILAGTGSVLLEPAKSQTRLPLEALREWKCSSPEASMEKALSLAHELGRNRSRIIALTDKAPPAGLATENILWMAFGNPQPNVGIINAARSVGEKKDRCMLEIGNFSVRPAATLLTLDFGRVSPPVKQTLDLSTGEVKRLTFDLPREAGCVRASISDDAMASDNQVYLLPHRQPAVRVALAIEDERLHKSVKDALTASGLLASGEDSPQLIITDAAIKDPSPDAWTLNIHAGSKASSLTGPFVIDTSHPLVKGIDLDGAIWGVDAGDTSSDFPSIISVGNTPVLIDQVFPSGRHEIRMLLTMSASTIHVTPNWPILFYNLLAWRSTESEGLAEVNVRCGSEILMRLDKKAPVEVIAPDGTKSSLRSLRKQLALEARSLGLYRVLAGEAEYIFACNLLSSDESDLGSCFSGQWGRLVNEDTLKNDYMSITWVLLLLSLLLLVVHQAVLRK